MVIKNLLTHEVTIIKDGHVVKRYPSLVETGEYECPRVIYEYKKVGEDNGTPIYEAVFGGIENLPAPEEGVEFIVSLQIAMNCPHRRDFLSPSKIMRKEGGREKGCEGLIRSSGNFGTHNIIAKWATAMNKKLVDKKTKEVENFVNYALA